MFEASWGWTLGCSKHVEDTMIELKHYCKKCAFCCMLSSGQFPDVWILYSKVSEHTVCSIFIGGTDSVFRNVVTQNSDAGELPRRKHTAFRTRRKFEIEIKRVFCWFLLHEYLKLTYAITFTESHEQCKTPPIRSSLPTCSSPYIINRTMRVVIDPHYYSRDLVACPAMSLCF